MIKSMTSFAKQESVYDEMTLNWEVKTVNSRFLDVHLRVPDSLRSLEMPLKAMVKQHIARGKVEIFLSLEKNSSNAAMPINLQLVEQLGKTTQQLGEHVLLQAIDPLKLLKWPGVIQTATQLTTENEQQILQSLENVLQKLVVCRTEEGQALVIFLLEKLDAMLAIHEQVLEVVPQAQTHFRDKLEAKLTSLTTELNSERLEQELVIFAQKADVQEELDRLVVHITAFKKLLNDGGVVGRRLDFLTQEMNREANTLGSKACHQIISDGAIELKVLIEQIKEQVQNIE